METNTYFFTLTLSNLWQHKVVLNKLKVNCVLANKIIKLRNDLPTGYITRFNNNIKATKSSSDLN